MDGTHSKSAMKKDEANLPDFNFRFQRYAPQRLTTHQKAVGMIFAQSCLVSSVASHNQVGFYFFS